MNINRQESVLPVLFYRINMLRQNNKDQWKIIHKIAFLDNIQIYID